MTLNEYIGTLTELMTNGIERDDEEIKKAWTRIGEGSRRKRPDIKSIESDLRIIKERERSIHNIKSQLNILESVVRLTEEEHKEV